MDLFEKPKGVVCVHLASGQDLIGTITSIDPYTIHKPMMPTMRQVAPEPNPRFSLSLLPLRPYLVEVTDLEVPRNHVVFVVPVSADMEKLYLQTTSGIIVPR